MKLPPIIAARVRRLVPLLASPHDGEVIATRNAIMRELASGERDLHDLAASIGAGADPSQPPAPCHSTSPMSFGDLARAARDLDGGRLTPRERKFVADSCRRGFAWQPTPKQAEWLKDILSRLKARAAA